MSAGTLSHAQAKALFDILTHAETYEEIRDFREPGSLDEYGPPFTHSSGRPSSSPALQALVSRFLLDLPGLKELSSDFWQIHIHDIIEDLEKAELSESYDKGVLGSRKTLATAISALIEYPIRGTYAGIEKPKEDKEYVYDLSKAEDLSKAFRDFMHQVVYGNVLEDLTVKAAKTDDLAEHEPIVRAVHEYVLVNIASFMHYTLVLSPKGQYLLKLIDSANKLVPYLVIRQTLKIGNVATMISAMMRVILAKMSVASVTNWIGLTQTDDDGQNLLQHIISQVLHWDNRDLEARAVKIEKERGTAGKEQLNALKGYVSRSREEHKWLREQSGPFQVLKVITVGVRPANERVEKQSRSLVCIILDDASIEEQIPEQHHKQALEYLNIQLSIRDRKELIRILCNSHPDHVTQSIRELVDAYEPVIRNVHNAVDLSDTVADAEKFIRDMIKVSKVTTNKDGSNITPTVGDFIQLLRRHQYSSHKFIHQACKNGKQVTNWYLDWARTAAGHFRRKIEPESGDEGAGDLTEPLNAMFRNLPEEKREAILPILDQQHHYVAEQHASSTERLAAVISSQPSERSAIKRILTGALSRPSSRPSSPDRDRSTDKPPTIESNAGPGSYLARWQDLLDSTLITPLTAHGPVRTGGSEEVMQHSTADVNGEKTVEYREGEAEQQLAKGQKTKRPDVSLVLDVMLKDFRKLLAERSCNW